MGILIPFPISNQRSAGAQGREASVSAFGHPKGELVLFTGVRYERTQDEPSLPPSNSHHAANGNNGRRRRR